MSDVMAANPQHYNIGGFSYGTLCNATASPIPPSQMGVCELFNQAGERDGAVDRPRPSSLRPAEPAASRLSAASERNGITVPDLEQ